MLKNGLLTNNNVNVMPFFAMYWQKNRLALPYLFIG